ncbi:hypothetical protein ONJ23_27325, partial [Salmonella enterica subsp. enterica serovar Virginia]|nr:hypothetical protein [Salmonella enterica subsp. enterica serovar Virginia]
ADVLVTLVKPSSAFERDTLTDVTEKVRKAQRVNPSLQPWVLLGRIEVMETAPALTRGAGLRYIIIFQNESQICSDNCYGPEGG